MAAIRLFSLMWNPLHLWRFVWGLIGVILWTSNDKIPDHLQYVFAINTYYCEVQKESIAVLTIMVSLRFLKHSKVFMLLQLRCECPVKWCNNRAAGLLCTQTIKPLVIGFDKRMIVDSTKCLINYHQNAIVILSLAVEVTVSFTYFRKC